MKKRCSISPKLRPAFAGTAGRSLILTLPILALVLVVFHWSGPAPAAEAQKTLQLVAKISPRASLSLSHSQLTFAGSEDQAVIPTQEGPLTITVKGRASHSRPLTITMRAETDLEGPAGRIPIGQVQWSAATEGHRGVLSHTQEQLVAQWTAGGAYSARVGFSLKNSGHLSPGEYGTALKFTLSSP